MGSVIVKGMEMPKNCRTCPMLFDGHNYRWCNITGESLGIEETDNGRDEHCPLVEIPTPHGRLIDADAIQDYNVETFGQRLLIIDTASTVIEGSET